MPSLLLSSVSQEGANAGQLTRCGRGTQTLSPSVCEKRAKVRCAEIEESRGHDLLSAIATEKID